MKRILGGTLLAAGLLLSSVAGSQAATHHHAATVNIKLLNDTPHGYYGRVSSGPEKCRVGRKVILQHGPSGIRETVGSDVTSSEGDWLVALDAPMAGEYRAVALPRHYKVHGHKHVCDRAVSPVINDV